MSMNSTPACSASTRAMSFSKQKLQPHERLAEELALLLLLERLVELLVRDQALAQQQGAQVRAGLVVEKGVVEARWPHVSRYRDFGRAA